MENKRLNREDLFNLIICDPVTTRGTIALSNMQLTETINPDFFFDKLYIKANVEKKANPISKDEELQYSYTEAETEQNISLYMYNRFKAMLLNDAPNSFPLLLLGSAGSGKSVEILHQLWEMKKENDDKYYCFYCNFEKSYIELTHGIKYRLKPEQINNPLWLITMTILSELYKLIIQNKDKSSYIYRNHVKYFHENGGADEKEQLLFKEIEHLNLDTLKSHQNVFKSLTSFMVEDVFETIEDLIKITMNVLYCICPQKKNILVFDNLEYYIKINQRDIPIHNSTLKDIYEITQRVSGTIEDIYNRISENESWRAFKIVIALRRTSTRLIMRNSNEQFVSQMLKKGQDITNYFNIWEIWNNKKKYLWEEHLKDKYSPEDTRIINILDDMMNDTPGRLGTSYQERIAILMNTSLRRNASAQSYTAYTLCEMLSNNKYFSINYEMYKLLLQESSSAVRYFYRHMLLELQYRRMIYSPESTNNFRKLKLMDKSKSCTLVRRVLSFLSHYKDENSFVDEDGKILKTNMYETVSLYKLMKHIFIMPNEISTYNISTKYGSAVIDDNINIIGKGNTFSELASVLIALANMNNFVNKTGPLIILGINDQRFNEDSSEEELVNILKEIWNYNEDQSENNNKYDKLNYGVRLTEAGAMFVFDIQPSFSFFAALNKRNNSPLFLLRDKNEIIKIINDVYILSDSICNIYENTAASFCGENSLIKNDLKYLPNNLISFRKRVKDMHKRHLNLYSDYISKSYRNININDADKNEIISTTNSYINKYEKWDDTKECF